MVKNETVESEKEKIIDDIEAQEINEDKLAALKAKINKGNNMPPKIS